MLRSTFLHNPSVGPVDPALEWLARKYLGHDISAWSIEKNKEEIKKRLFSEVEEIVWDTGQKEPPFQLEPIAERRKARIEEIVLSRADALLVPVREGFIIKVNVNSPSFKKRFGIAHEIGHTFFYDLTANPPKRSYEYQKRAYWVEEGLACEIAREILLPSFSVTQRVREKFKSSSIDYLRKLTEDYQVSYDPLRLRLINDLRLWDCIIFRSIIKDGKVKTLKRDISKGQSYRYLRIPSLLEAESKDFSALHSLIMLAEKEKEVQKQISIGKRAYIAQSLLLYHLPPTCLTLLRREE